MPPSRIYFGKKKGVRFRGGMGRRKLVAYGRGEELPVPYSTWIGTGGYRDI
jgi:hypothetical protein